MTPYEREIAKMVGESVRAMRERRGVSRETVAGWLGQTYDAVAKAERGERRFSIADITRMVLEFECSADELIFGTGPRPTLQKIIRFPTRVA